MHRKFHPKHSGVLGVMKQRPKKENKKINATCHLLQENKPNYFKLGGLSLIILLVVISIQTRNLRILHRFTWLHTIPHSSFEFCYWSQHCAFWSLQCVQTHPPHWFYQEFSNHKGCAQYLEAYWSTWVENVVG